jgi:hypothetical protein
MARLDVKYIKAVLDCYDQKKKANELRSGLAHPSPARLREECLFAFKNRYSGNDRQTLLNFFGVANESELSERFIKKFDRDKFRPVAKFIQRQVEDPDPKNVELVAWLIEFEPRPCANWTEVSKKKHSADDQKNGRYDTGGSTQSTSAGSNEGPYYTEQGLVTIPVPGGKSFFNFRTVIVFGLVLIFLVAFAFVYKTFYNNSDNRKFPESGLCMYWAGDRYVRISCDQKLGDNIIVIAYDSVVYHNMRRVTEPDTITFHSIGKLWYIKRNNQYEFFTCAGKYPLDLKSDLRPATQRIIKNLIDSRHNANSK